MTKEEVDKYLVLLGWEYNWQKASFKNKEFEGGDMCQLIELYIPII